eukprot:2263805-Pleurochrysis_carterae.AAC.3
MQNGRDGVGVREKRKHGENKIGKNKTQQIGRKKHENQRGGGITAVGREGESERLKERESEKGRESERVGATAKMLVLNEDEENCNRKSGSDRQNGRKEGRGEANACNGVSLSRSHGLRAVDMTL